MTAQSSDSEFDAIVIGSGMGGMAAATALSRMKHKVLLLEQAQTIGGLTHTFSRDGLFHGQVSGALWSGILTAAAIDPRIYTKPG